MMCVVVALMFTAIGSSVGCATSLVIFVWTGDVFQAKLSVTLLVAAIGAWIGSAVAAELDT